jgi:hypothetical protein
LINESEKIKKNAWTEVEAASFMESEPSSEKIFLLKIKKCNKNLRKQIA